ncbi:hypothetical protein HanRHA438_Chr08g0329341 [Helianthus annuus]|nr:hypothetical protein HanRHA438_Chr08g0329341 [Helianthus annuus]
MVSFSLFMSSITSLRLELPTGFEVFVESSLPDVSSLRSGFATFSYSKEFSCSSLYP